MGDEVVTAHSEELAVRRRVEHPSAVSVGNIVAVESLKSSDEVGVGEVVNLVGRSGVVDIRRGERVSQGEDIGVDLLSDSIASSPSPLSLDVVLRLGLEVVRDVETAEVELVDGQRNLSVGVSREVVGDTLAACVGNDRSRSRHGEVDDVATIRHVHIASGDEIGHDEVSFLKFEHEPRPQFWYFYRVRGWGVQTCNGCHCFVGLPRLLLETFHDSLNGNSLLFWYAELA